MGLFKVECVCCRASCGARFTCSRRKWISTASKVTSCLIFYISSPFVYLSLVTLCVFPECSGAEAVLSVRLKFAIMHRDSPGQVVQLRFDSEHLSKLQEAMGRVFMVPANQISADISFSENTIQIYFIVIIIMSEYGCVSPPLKQRVKCSSDGTVQVSPPLKQKVKCSSDGTVQVSPPADKHNRRSYIRKKTESKLKGLQNKSPKFIILSV